MKAKSKIVVATVVGAALVLTASRTTCHALAGWRQARWLRDARQYVQENESRKALLCLENALKHNPNDIEACRLMASVTEASRLPVALAWRNRVLELNPRSLDDRIALAQTALLFDDARLAASVLGNVSPDIPRTAQYFNTAGAVSCALNEPEEAATNFLAASRLDPTKEVPRFNLALIELRAPDAAIRDKARAMVATMSTNIANPDLKTMALRELARDALRNNQSDLALERTDQLLRETNCVWTDRLLQLQALKKAKDPRFQSTLSRIEQEASLNTSTLYECASWEMEFLSPADALNWLRALPPNLQTNQPAALLIAECLASKQDWRALADSISTAKWGEWEFVRHAFLARALQGEEMKVTSQTEWAAALKGAANRQAHLHILLGLATQWNWRHEQQTVLWNLVDAHPEEHWAVGALSQSLFRDGQTRSLMKLWNQERRRSPSNLTAANNLALTALLLDAKEFAPHDLARDVYQQAGTNANYASTYAFSLYLQGKYGEALEVMNRLAPQELNNPTIAGYYGLLLKASGQEAIARSYLEKASRAALLPEERKIILPASENRS